MKEGHDGWSWPDVLESIDESIELYKKIKTSKLPKEVYGGETQPIFLDLIIRLLIAKGYVISKLDRPI